MLRFCRAKRAPTSPRGRSAVHAFGRKEAGEDGAVSRLGRPSMAGEVWPGKHLRVVVVPPLENAEVRSHAVAVLLGYVFNCHHF